MDFDSWGGFGGTMSTTEKPDDFMPMPGFGKTTGELPRPEVKPAEINLPKK
jgi:hypothetical protein